MNGPGFWAEFWRGLKPLHTLRIFDTSSPVIEDESYVFDASTMTYHVDTIVTMSPCSFDVYDASTIASMASMSKTFDTSSMTGDDVSKKKKVWSGFNPRQNSAQNPGPFIEAISFLGRRVCNTESRPVRTVARGDGHLRREKRFFNCSLPASKRCNILAALAFPCHTRREECPCRRSRGARRARTPLRW